MYGLGLFYVAGALNPSANLRHFPIAIVNQDTGLAGKLIADGLVTNMDKNQFDIRVLSADQARSELDTAQVYAEMLLPADLSRRLFALPTAALQPGKPAKPVITIMTSPRASTVSATIAEKVMRKALAVADARAGQMLTKQLQLQSDGAPVPGGALLALASPIDIESAAGNALPSDGGSGLSVFYLSLLLVIAGVTAAIVVSMTFGALLDRIPASFGRCHRLASRIRTSRLQTLLVQWVLMALLGLSTSAVYLWIAAALGMPAPHLLSLWLFGAFIVTAVGVVSTSLIAVLGTWGTLISLFVFIFLGLPSAGATIPLEASPRFLGWLARFEPMRQAFVGSRSLLYLDGRGQPELMQSLATCVLGLGVGMLVGALVTWMYDRKAKYCMEAAAPVLSPRTAAPQASS